jgi:hypothetical protein
MSNVTRIADLPSGKPEDFQNVMVKEQPTNYVPINVHPNPYGISEQNPIEPGPPANTQVEQQMPSRAPSQVQEVDYRQVVAQQELPSRDIPMDSTQYTQDVEANVNYIPAGPPDYLNKYEEEERKNIAYEQGKHRERMMDVLMDEVQLAVYVGMLFFLFQTTIVRKFITNNFTWLPIINSDGNFNGYGILFKSALFGLFFYTSQKLTDMLMVL